MLERYSDEARRAVELAVEEASNLGHPYVGTEHLLLGLLGDRNTAAAQALAAGGASLALCREKVVEALASRSTSTLRAPTDQLSFTDRATRSLERASRLAPRMGSEVVRPEHVLLSVLDVEGTAGQVLRGLSVDLTAVRQALAGSPAKAAPSAPPSDESDEPAAVTTPKPAAAKPAAAESKPKKRTGSQRPVCGKCGSALVGSLGRAEMKEAGVVVVYCTTCGTALGVFPQASPHDSTGFSSG